MTHGQWRKAASVITLVVALVAVTFLGTLGGCRRPGQPAEPPSGVGGGGSGGAGPGSGGSGVGSVPTTPVPRSLEKLSPALAPGCGLAWVTATGALVVASPWLVEPRTVASDCGGGGFAWGHDGTYLLYLSQKEMRGEGKLLRLPLDGTTPVDLASFTADDMVHSVGCSPDGRYWTLQSGTSSSFGLDIGGGDLAKPVRLGVTGSFAWCPEGPGLAYTESREDLPSGPIEGGVTSVRLLNVATGETTLVAEGVAGHHYSTGAWSGKSLLYYTETITDQGADFPRVLWSVDPFAATPTPARADKLPPPLARDAYDYVRTLIPAALTTAWNGGWAWSPDGSALTFMARDDAGRNVLYILDPATVAYGVLGEGYPVLWSPAPPGTGGGN